MRETFDSGERPGFYLKPMFRTTAGRHAGGALVTLEGAVCRGEHDAAAAGTVFTPPIFAGDALRGTRNPLFALRALREFVAICLDAASGRYTTS